MNTDPRPTSLWADTEPPWTSASLRVSARPRPVPACRRASGESTCSNGSNTRSSCSAAIPMPVSHTSMAIEAPCVRALTPTCPPGSVNFTALESRFSSIWRARRASARAAGSADGTSTRTVMSRSRACSRIMPTDWATTSATSTSTISVCSRSASALARSRMSATSASRCRPLDSICAMYSACLSVSGPCSWRASTADSPMTELSGARSSWLMFASFAVIDPAPDWSICTEVMAVTCLVPLLLSDPWMGATPGPGRFPNRYGPPRPPSRRRSCPSGRRPGSPRRQRNNIARGGGMLILHEPFSAWRGRRFTPVNAP